MIRTVEVEEESEQETPKPQAEVLATISQTELSSILQGEQVIRAQRIILASLENEMQRVFRELKAKYNLPAKYDIDYATGRIFGRSE